MGFRDEGDAARARADALERDLAEKEAQLEALKAQLAEKDEALRAAEADEDEDGAEERSEADPDRALEALKRKKERHDRERADADARARSAERSEQDREAERRRLASVSVWGDIDLGDVAPVMLAPTLLGTVFLGMQWRGFFALVPAGVILVMLAAKYWGRDWARRLWREEERWARSLPYVMEGYPEMLGRKPAWRSGMPLFRLDGEEHHVLELELELSGGRAPSDLVDVLRGFDPELGKGQAPDPSMHERIMRRTRGEPDPEPRDDVFHRPSPTSQTRTKSGSSRTEDHNRALRDWVRRLEREALRPLHAKHRIRRVVLRLR